MSMAGYVHFLVTAAMVVAFFGSPEPIESMPPTGHVLSVRALPDKTALLGWGRARGGFLTRVRSDGTTMWARALGGRLRNDNLVVVNGDVAVPFQEGTAVVIAMYAIDGERRWQRTLSKLDRRRDAEAAAELVTVTFIDRSLVVRYFVGEQERVAVLRRTDGQVVWDEKSDLEGGIIPLGTSHFLVQGVFETREYDLRSGESQTVGDGCVVGDRYVTANELGVVDIRACGRYRGRDAWVAETAAGTTLVERSSDGATVLQHALPAVRQTLVHELFGFPWASTGFAGEMPRFVPLIAREGDRERAILVDLESGEIVGHSDVDDNIQVFRDGDASYVLYGFVPAVAAFDPSTHTLGPFQADSSHFGVRPDEIAAGLFWMHSSDDTRIDAPEIRPVAL